MSAAANQAEQRRTAERSHPVYYVVVEGKEGSLPSTHHVGYRTLQDAEDFMSAMFKDGAERVTILRRWVA